MEAQIPSATVNPHPALRATFSRKREKGCLSDHAIFANADEGRSAPPLPLAGEGWGEGKPRPRKLVT
jgi:hypothetical protein